jgi:tetratricopeptide (TPR) repeat protein
MALVRKLFVAVGLSLLPISLVSADTVWVGTGANPIKYSDVKISAVDGDNLIYSTASGDAKKPLAQVQQISVDGETDFDAAEEAFRAGKWPDAVDGYQKAIGSTSTDWVKARSSIRLVEAAAKTNRFDAAITAYVALVQANPKAAEKAKPSVPDATSPYLDPAVTTINQALNASGLSDSQRSSLLGLLLDIDQVKKDTAGATSVLEQLSRLGTLSPEATAGLKIQTASVALQQKNYQKALDDIQKNSSLFADPAQQVEALNILAQAQDGLNGDKDDSNALKDLAIAYMRVVTFGKDLPGQPHVAQSLLRVAQLEEKLKEPKVALQLYQQIAAEKDFADDPAQADAKKSVERLKGT